MNSLIVEPKQSLKAIQKIKPSRQTFNLFKEQLACLIDRIDEKEYEEHLKNLVSDFLKKTYYEPRYYINTKDRKDLVIHNGRNSKSSVGVIIETKHPNNKSEMITKKDLNAKAIQELLLYFLRERILNSNLDLKYLIVTNIYEWFIFDAKIFEDEFAQDQRFVKIYKNFEEKRLSGDKTQFFYDEIAKPHIDLVKNKLKPTYFDIRQIDSLVRSSDSIDDHLLIPIFKILSPEYLLKIKSENDNNTLDKGFYSELLHIVGLQEVKIRNKKLIKRCSKDSRKAGALMENVINQLEMRDRLSRVNDLKKYGDNKEDQLFNIGLELIITWIDRILFLKLLESQLLKYNKNNNKYKFLNKKLIIDYDSLDSLFFDILAKKPTDRDKDLNNIFKNVPYLNSSLFEPTELEHNTIFISSLRNSLLLQTYKSSVLCNESDHKLNKSINALEYLIEFLNAYDFSSDPTEEIQEDGKPLINASVLGLIFEKINGYKEGSYFTPSSVTMYMCRNSIRKTVINKFNEVKNWDCNSITEIHNKIINHKEANKIINSIKICDPAVGSGHFLVSALNELIVIKHDLGILYKIDGKKFKNYNFEIDNDELVITDEDNDHFIYKRNIQDSQVIQETLFYEKETLIENCLFGVDINQISVNICRLRLWIELLKNSYYKPNGELETLPNIDINIKCGNSLISRFDLKVSIQETLVKKKWTIEDYRIAIQEYHSTKNRNKKQEIISFIKKIKDDITIDIDDKHPKIKSLIKYLKELNSLKYQQSLFPDTKTDEEKKRKRILMLDKEIQVVKSDIEKIKNNVIFKNAFEWRIEFPEILNEKGDFIGFDLIIGNPPYGVPVFDKEREYIIKTLSKVPDHEIYYWFKKRAYRVLKRNGILSFIIPNSMLFNVFAKNYRLDLFDNWGLDEILDCTDFEIFKEATVRNIIFIFTKDIRRNHVGYKNTYEAKSFDQLISRPLIKIDKKTVIENNNNWALLFKLPGETLDLVQRIKKNCKPLKKYFPETSQGLIAYDKYTGQSEKIIESRAFHSFKKVNESYKKWLHGGDVVRYGVKWNGKEYIKYCKEIANPRRPRYFKRKRILVREITNPRIYAAYTDKELYNDPSIIIILESIDSEISLFTLLGILNSEMASFYHFNSSPKATKGAFPKILVKDINDFPLPKEIDKEIQKKIAELVEEILLVKSNLTSKSTDLLESEIDLLVNKFYGIDGVTDREIINKDLEYRKQKSNRSK